VEDGMTREVRYREVPAEEVPLREREAAAGAVSWAGLDLEIPAPVVRWFTEAGATSAEFLAGMGGGNMPPPPEGSFDHRPIRGYVSPQDPGVVWLHAGMGRVQAAATALHEACHSWQHSVAGPARGPVEFSGREAQAATYARDQRELARSIANATREGAHDG
jgi:hypothetical protein